MSARRAALAALALAASLHPGTALAQVDIEYRDTTLEGEKFQHRVGFEAEWHEYNNIDFRALDETSDQSILDSDDRGSFAFTGIAAALGYNVDDHTRFVIGASHRGLWGNDQFGKTDSYLGWLYFNAVYADFDTGGKHPWRFRVGRQFFSIGGIPGPEFIFLDIVDGLRVDVPLGGVGYIAVLPIEVPSSSSANDHVNFVDYIGQDRAVTFGFRGDTLTRRHGAVVVLDKLVKNFDARVYGFYTDVGARGSGSDITYNGALGNFADGDWVLNAGVRASYKAGPVTPWASFDMSSGVDRKELVASDVDSNGFSWYAGVDLKVGEDSGPRAQVYYFDTFGPGYLGNGLQYSHGYVGMKAQQVGGVVSNRYMGWHPTAYVAMWGVEDTPHDIDRKAGTRVIAANAGYKAPRVFEGRVSWWFMQDRGITFMDPQDLDTLDPPYGYSREEFAAEERLGRVLGNEFDIDLDFAVTQHVKLHANGGILLPGAFYEIETARVAGTALGGDQMAWAANLATRLIF